MLSCRRILTPSEKSGFEKGNDSPVQPRSTGKNYQYYNFAAISKIIILIKQNYIIDILLSKKKDMLLEDVCCKLEQLYFRHLEGEVGILGSQSVMLRMAS